MYFDTSQWRNHYTISKFIVRNTNVLIVVLGSWHYKPSKGQFAIRIASASRACGCADKSGLCIPCNFRITRPPMLEIHAFSIDDLGNISRMHCQIVRYKIQSRKVQGSIRINYFPLRTQLMVVFELLLHCIQHHKHNCTPVLDILGSPYTLPTNIAPTNKNAINAFHSSLKLHGYRP